MVVRNHDLDLGADGGWLFFNRTPALGAAPWLAGGVSQFLCLRLAWACTHASLRSMLSAGAGRPRPQPGGHSSRLPPSTCACTWKTVCPAPGPVLNTTR